MTGGIGTLGERSLHAQLKRWYAKPADRFEQPVDGYVIDLVRGELLVELQTGSFGPIRRKLETLTNAHPVRVVHPIACETWIVRFDATGAERLGRRKSPRRRDVHALFEVLVGVPDLVARPALEIEALLVQVEEERHADGRGSWRRQGQSIVDRRLLAVTGRRLFAGPADFLALVPPAIGDPFTTRDLSAALDLPLWLARKMAYCLKRMGAVRPVGKRVNAILYERAPAPAGAVSR